MSLLVNLMHPCKIKIWISFNNKKKTTKTNKKNSPVQSDFLFPFVIIELKENALYAIQSIFPATHLLNK